MEGKVVKIEEMMLIFFQLIDVSTQQGRKTASMPVTHVCRIFPFLFRLIHRSTEKIFESILNI